MYELAQYPAERQGRINFSIDFGNPAPAATLPPPTRRPEQPKQEIKPTKAEMPHVKLDEVVRKLRAGLNVMLVGPAGSGKTTLADQAAAEMGLKFGFISCSAGMSEGQITGRLLPVGIGGQFVYVPTEFVEIYENGGVFLFDEFDAADPNVLIVVNAAIAGKKLSLPNRPEKPYADKHEFAYIITAGNTYGSGADAIYVGRNQLDGATLSRFACGFIQVDYDRDLETKLVPDKQLRDLVWKLRELCMTRKFRRIMGTRELIAASRMKKAGFTIIEIFQSLIASWSADEQKTAENS